MNKFMFLIAVLLVVSCGGRSKVENGQNKPVSKPTNQEPTGDKNASSKVPPVLNFAAVINIDGTDLEIQKSTIDEFASVKPLVSSDGKISRQKIREIAKAYGLFTEKKCNPHLSFLDGDISYWHEQNLSIERYKLEFASRAIVLKDAEVPCVTIKDQGTLSWAAQQIAAQLVKARNKK